MQIIKNELKEIRERIIINHLIELNKDNDTVAIEVDELTVRVYATKPTGTGKIYLKKENYKEENQRQVGMVQEVWIGYDCGNERYNIFLNPYDTFEIYKI